MAGLEKILVGLTGNIASGKSEAAKKFEDLGAYVIDADRVGHEAYEKSLSLRYRLAKEFGISVLKWDLSVDRKKLGSIIFSDPEKRKRLNEIAWPYIAKGVAAKVAGTEGKIVIIEAALIFEAGWDKFLNYTVCITCKDSLRKERLIEKRNLSGKEAEERIKAQMGQYEKALKSDYTIENESGLDQLSARVLDVWHDLQAKARSASP